MGKTTFLVVIAMSCTCSVNASVAPELKSPSLRSSHHLYRDTYPVASTASLDYAKYTADKNQLLSRQLGDINNGQAAHDASSTSQVLKEHILKTFLGQHGPNSADRNQNATAEPSLDGQGSENIEDGKRAHATDAPSEEEQRREEGQGSEEDSKSDLQLQSNATGSIRSARNSTSTSKDVSTHGISSQHMIIYLVFVVTMVMAATMMMIMSGVICFLSNKVNHRQNGDNPAPTSGKGSSKDLTADTPSRRWNGIGCIQPPTSASEKGEDRTALPGQRNVPPSHENHASCTAHSTCTPTSHSQRPSTATRTNVASLEGSHAAEYNDIVLPVDEVNIPPRHHEWVNNHQRDDSATFISDLSYHFDDYYIISRPKGCTSNPRTSDLGPPEAIHVIKTLNVSKVPLTVTVRRQSQYWKNIRNLGLVADLPDEDVGDRHRTKLSGRPRSPITIDDEAIYLPELPIKQANEINEVKPAGFTPFVQIVTRLEL